MARCVISAFTITIATTLNVAVDQSIVDQPIVGFDIVQYADSFVGNPYVWGGNSLTNGCDCSHFVWNVLKDTGHYNGDYAISDDWIYLGDYVQGIQYAVAGDVIIYPGHIAIYDGNGLLIQALNSESGIVHNRPYDCDIILAIRHFN